MRRRGAWPAQRSSMSCGDTPCFSASVCASDRSRAVAVYPGQTLLTSTLYGPYSLERLLIRAFTPERTELERIRPSIGCLTDTEVMAMNRPQRRCCISGRVSLAKYTVLMRLRSDAACQSATVVSANVLEGGPPALATQISMRPNSPATA